MSVFVGVLTFAALVVIAVVLWNLDRHITTLHAIVDSQDALIARQDNVISYYDRLWLSATESPEQQEDSRDG